MSWNVFNGLTDLDVSIVVHNHLDKLELYEK